MDMGGRIFRSDNRSWSSEGLLSPEPSGAEAHNLGIGNMLLLLFHLSTLFADSRRAGTSVI